MSPVQQILERTDARQASSPVLIRELTESELQDVTAYGQPRGAGAAAASPDPPFHHRERRSDRRHACSLAACCDPVAGNGRKPWAAEVKDISAGGIALVLERRFEPGTILVVEPSLNKAETAGSLLARVVRTQAHGPGRWIIGCKLGYRLSDDDLRRLIEAWGGDGSGIGNGGRQAEGEEKVL